jgi:hypothetical protein
VYRPAFVKAQEELALRNPHRVAVCADVAYEPLDEGRGRFSVPLAGRLHQIDWPQGAISQKGGDKPVDIATSIVLLHYLLAADGTPLAGQWIAFRNLPGGLGYDAAFQGRANRRLAHAFGTDQAGFEWAARLLGGERLDFGDSSFLFRLLPRVWLAVVLHLADDEFPASANVLFDASASHYLPTEDLAVLGGILAGRLVKHRRSSESARDG